MQFFRDCESGGAWPFLVRGVNCLLNCDNGRDLCLVIVRRAARRVRRVCAWGGASGGRGDRGVRVGVCVLCMPLRAPPSPLPPPSSPPPHARPPTRSPARQRHASFTGTIAYKAPEA